MTTKTDKAFLNTTAANRATTTPALCTGSPRKSGRREREEIKSCYPRRKEIKRCYTQANLGTRATTKTKKTNKKTKPEALTKGKQSVAQCAAKWPETSAGPDRNSTSEGPIGIGRALGGKTSACDYVKMKRICSKTCLPQDPFLEKCPPPFSGVFCLFVIFFILIPRVVCYIFLFCFCFLIPRVVRDVFSETPSLPQPVTFPG